MEKLENIDGKSHLGHCWTTKINNKLGLSWAKLSPRWDWTVITIYYIELINKIEWSV